MVKDAGVGANSDSYYEYLLKAHILFGEEDLYELWAEVRPPPLQTPASTYRPGGFVRAGETWF